MLDDPWSEIGIPEGISTFSSRRVDVDSKWDFFWALSSERKLLLLLRHDALPALARRSPQLRGLDIRFTGVDDSGNRLLVLRLLDSTQKDLFHKLCIDIIAATSLARSEGEALHLALMRTWRWHYLLRTGRRGFLSPEQQKGLIGELLVLETHLLPNLSSLEAVEAWRGPLEATKDFEIGRLCIEAKTRRGTATPHIIVSSEHQLDSEGIDSLFLHVVELDSVSPGTMDCFSLTDVVSRVQSRVTQGGNETADAFEERLAASGYCHEDDYSGSMWVQGKSLLYRIAEGFPRIVSWGLNTGVTKVRYSVSLAECAPFLCVRSEFEQVLSEMKDG